MCIQLLNKKKPAANHVSGHVSCRHHASAGIQCRLQKISPQLCLRTRQPTGTHASTQKRVGLELDHAIAAPVVMPAHLLPYKKDDPRRHRSLVVEFEHVGLHLLEPRHLPWRRF